MEWKEVRLGEVIDYKKGFAFKSSMYNSTGTYIVRISDTTANSVDVSLCNCISPELAQQYTDYSLKTKDIIIATVGSWPTNPASIVGKVVRVPESADNALLNQNAVRIRSNGLVDSDYLYYLLKEGHFSKYLVGTAQGSANQASITLKDIFGYSFSAPSTKEDQRRIASILFSLDRKIELNNKINADLEEMAQAIFKNWFVDFEPFKDGKFVDSELGMIPEGWKVGSYSEMIESLISGDWGKETPQGNYTHEVACVRGCDFQDINNGVRGKTPQRYILEKNYQTKHLKDKDILVEISGGTATVSTGRTSLVTEELLKKYKHDIVCTNFCKVLRPLSQFSSYVYYSWKYKYDNDIMFGYENGTSGIKNFAIKDFIEKELVLIPKEQDIVEFQKIIDNLQKQKQIKGTENTTLFLLRDTLLPRLMSGEIEVLE